MIVQDSILVTLTIRGANIKRSCAKRVLRENASSLRGEGINQKEKEKVKGNPADEKAYLMIDMRI